MDTRKSLLVGFGALLVLAVAIGLTFASADSSASDAAPTQEPVDSPFFDATLQQAVDELDGKVSASAALQPPQHGTQHYTTDLNVWPECEFGFTRDLVQWPDCHYTSDPATPGCDTPWPTLDYTWNAEVWPECNPAGGPGITQDPTNWWCDSSWTHDPIWGPQCEDPNYTRDPVTWPWCNPRYTTDPALWPQCPPGAPYTYAALWPECDQAEYTTDPYRWPACHYTSDPGRFPACAEPVPTRDYTSDPILWPECPGPEYTLDPMHWPWCDPGFTMDPRIPPCDQGIGYTQEPAIWPWCQDPLYTAEPARWPLCHFTSDPIRWPKCADSYPTKDYTWDSNVWPECGVLTQDPFVWPWCAADTYTQDVVKWPWCAPAWTWQPDEWLECQPGYTNDPGTWPECDEGLYTQEPATWPECAYYTADAWIWPECHYTSDPLLADCDGNWFPTKDYTNDTQLWPECAAPPGYTSDPQLWPECHYTSDPAQWPECQQLPELGDLGDAPDSTNHAGVGMTAYPAGGPAGVVANYPTVFDPTTGFPQGPKHWNPRADAWLGPWVTLENDADLLPDEDGVTNIDPPADAPDRDEADDGLIPRPMMRCQPTFITYTVTISGSLAYDRFVNVWYDWNRDGDWEDTPVCPDGTPAPEWAVRNQVIPPLPPGTYVFATPVFLPYSTSPTDSLWMRISIAEKPAPTSPVADIADGRGPSNGYLYGETEDYYLSPFVTGEEPGDLGDAPDSSNHAGVNMTAYPAGGPPGVVAHYPTVFDPATGLPQGPKHWKPRADAWLGPWVTLENDADLPPDEDPVTNIDPPADRPNRDGADDGVLSPVPTVHCQRTLITYTVSVTPGAAMIRRFVNVWYDWNRDGDWQDALTCTVPGDAPEWAVQNQVLPPLPPGTHVFATPLFLPYNPNPDDPIWMRISIANEEAPTVPGANIADGRGPGPGYLYGETEDYYFAPPSEEYDIYIKDSDVDDGSVPSSSPFWVSPDIWVRHDGDCTNTDHQNPVPGATETICVRVRNRMPTTVDNITVDVYWGAAALGLSWPGSWSYVDSLYIPSLAGGATAVQSVSWNVPMIAGHFCLLARADSLQDPLSSGPDTVAPVDRVQNNNNIAQANAVAVAYPEITYCGFFTGTVQTDVVYFDAVNTSSTTKTVDIEFDSADFPLGSATIIVEPGSLWGRWTTLTNFNQVGTTLLPTAFPATIGGIAMGPYETAQMTMTIAAEIDVRFTIDVEEWVGGAKVGGIEYVRDLPVCVYLPLVMKHNQWAVDLPVCFRFVRGRVSPGGIRFAPGDVLFSPWADEMVPDHRETGTLCQGLASLPVLLRRTGDQQRNERRELP